MIKYQQKEVVTMTKKKRGLIENLGSENKLIVQKSLPLFSLWRSELTLAEFKILDTYLARIDSHRPDKRTVVFTKGELEEKLGVKKINQKDLKLRLKHLMGNVVEVEDNTSKNGFMLITLFEEVDAEQDDNGLWQITLECTQKAMKYIFNVDNLGYLRYKLRCITSITSRYTYIMFNYLEHNRFRKTWEVSLDALKEILNCDKVETYSIFKEFNKQVLKRVQTEMQAKTECKYTYEPVKKGRNVVAIRFTVETLADIVPEVPEPEELVEIPIDSEAELWETPLEPWKLTAEQKTELRAVLVTVPESKLPSAAACNGSKEIMWYHYIDQKVKEIERRNAEKKIRSKFSYLLKLLKNDAEPVSELPTTDAEQAKTQQSNRFNDFPQRKYSTEEVSEIEQWLLNKRGICK